MGRRAQVTLFLIIGIVILFIVLILLFGLKKPSTEQALDILFDEASIKGYISNCIKETAEQGLIVLGKQGGYLAPERFVASEKYKIAYLYDKGISKVPGRQSVESALAAYIDSNMISCLDNFGSMKKQGWVVTYELPKTKAVINQKDINIIQSFLVGVKKDSTLTFNQFGYTVPVRMGYILDIASEIVAFHMIEPQWTDLTALSRHDLEINIFPFKQKLTYSIRDPQSSIKSQAYLFNFALEFG